MKQFTVEKLISDGYSFARDENGKVVLLTEWLPGETVEAVKLKGKESVEFWKTVRVVQSSPDRKIKGCKGFPDCGGCDWGGLQYSNQLLWKKRIVQEQFRRVGKFYELPDFEMIPSKKTSHYRNRMEYVAYQKGKKIRFGMYKRFSNEVVDVEDCDLGYEGFEKVRRTFEEILSRFGVKPYNRESKRGFLKHLVLRGNRNGDIVALLITKRESFPEIDKIGREVKEQLPEVTSLVHVFNSRDDVVLRGPYRVIYGEGIITETFGDAVFQVPPVSFFQANVFVMEELLKYVQQELNPSPSETFLDLYSGIGTFAFYFARMFKKVVAVEGIKISSRAMLSNARINMISNLEAVNLDTRDFLEKNEEKFDKVILDPPRAGIGKDIELIGKALPKRIVYISCNPTTLARDSRYLSNKGFSLKALRAFDMFPDTHHVEVVATFNRV